MASSAELAAVTVSALRPILERKDEKIIYNAENDPSNTGVSTMELLRKIPYVSVDGDENLKIKGSTKYRIKINGKSSGMITKNPKEVLRSFPANTIVRVELTTTPSAKDDAEGAQAVLNIITKKKLQGYTANIAAGTTTLKSHRGNASLEVKMGDIGVSAYGGGQYQEPLKNTGFYHKETGTNTENPLIFDSENESFSRNYHYYSNAEIAWDIDSMKTLSLYGNANEWSNAGTASSINYFTDNKKTFTNQNLNKSSSLYSGPGKEIGLDFIQKLKGEDHEITASALYNTDNIYDFATISRNEQFPVLAQKYLYNRNTAQNTETTFALDYSRPLTKTQSLSVGTKGIVRSINSDFAQYNVNPNTGEQVAIAEQTNVFDYAQSVYALYADYRLKLKKFTLHPGLRAEQTLIAANFKTTNTTANQNYTTFNPSFSVSYKQSDATTWNFSYSQGISRPLVWFLNPYLNNTSAQYFSQGNPDLQPERRNNFEVEYSTSKDGKNLNISLYERYTTNMIEQYATIREDGITFSKYYNLGTQHDVGTSVNVSGDIIKNLNMNMNIDLYYQFFNSNFQNTAQTNSGIAGWLWSNLTYTLPKGYKIGANGNFSPGNVTPQGRNLGWWNYTFEASKAFFSQSLRVRAFVEAPFHEMRTYGSESAGSGFAQSNRSYQPVRAFGIGLRYKFGALKAGVSRKRGIRNTDGKSK